VPRGGGRTGERGESTAAAAEPLLAKGTRRMGAVAEGCEVPWGHVPGAPFLDLLQQSLARCCERVTFVQSFGHWEVKGQWTDIASTLAARN